MILQLIDPAQHHFQVGEQHLFAEAAQLVGQVAAAMAAEYDEQSAAIAQDGQPARIVAAFADHQAGRVEEFDLAGGRFFWVELGGEPIEPFVRHVGLADLALLALGGVGLGPGDPLEDRAFAGASEACDADFHNEFLP